MAEDSIFKTVELICKDSKNINNIHDLLKELENGNEVESSNSAEILFQVFLFHINEGTFKNKALSNNKSNPNEAREASDTVSLWLSSSYTAFIGLLCTKICHDSTEVQGKMLRYFVDITNANFSFEMKNRDKPVKEALQVYFPSAFNLLVKELLVTDSFSTKLSESLSSVVQFADISYYLLKSIPIVFNTDDNDMKINISNKRLENALKLMLLASKNAAGIDAKSPRIHAQKFLEDQELCCKITNNIKKLYKSVFTNAWFLLLRQPKMTSITRDI